jgi:hypothetical protein
MRRETEGGRMHGCRTPEEAKRHVGPGWAALVDRAFAALDACGADYSVEQVKEKFGGLRIYYLLYDAPDDDALHGLIAKIEEESRKTCEECGQPGKARKTGYWWKTVCLACHTARQLKGER